MSDFNIGYDLGYKHGYNIAKIDAKIESLRKELGAYGEEEQERADEIAQGLKEDGVYPYEKQESN